jgi:hypothetical protein
MNTKKIFSYFILLSLFVLPLFTFAQPTDPSLNSNPTPSAPACSQPNDIGQLFVFSICLMTRFVIPFLFGLALVMFLVGIIKYVKGGDNEEAREAGRGLMLFGIIALFVMVAVWGLVKILFATIFPSSPFELPSLPPQSSSPFN